MITETQKSVLKLSSNLYFYLNDQPFYWKSDFSGVEFKTKKTVWIKWILGQLVPWSYAPILIYVSATHLFLRPRRGLGIIKLAAYFFVCCAIWGAQAVSLVVLHDGTSFAQGYNGLFAFERNLVKFTNSRIDASNEITKRQVTQDHVLDCVIVFFTLAIAAAPAFVIPVCLFLDFDGYYFLFEDLFTNAEYITVEHIVLSFLIRMVLDLMLVTQIGRLVTFLVTAMLIYGNSIKVVCENLTILFLNGIHTESLIRLYTSIYVLFNVIQERLDRILCLALSAIFLSSLPPLWVSTKEYGLVDELLYSFSVVVSLFLVVLPLIIFKQITNISKTSVVLLLKMRVKALFATGVRHTKQTRWELRKVKVLRKIKFGYGTFFEMENDAVASYFMQLMDKWVSAVLLF